MTRDEIISTAKSAGFRASVGRTDKEGNYHPNRNAIFSSVPIEWVERFAELVAAHEREACAKVVHDYAESIYLFQNESQLIEAEKRIRARAKEQTP